MLFIAFVCGFLRITSADPFKEDLVYPELLQERSESGQLLLQIQDTTLHLKKSSVLAHDLFLDTSDGDESEYTLWNGTSLEENLYHDSEHQSSIMLHQDDGAVKVEGMLSPSWRIAPLSSIERSEDAAVPHRIYRIADTDHRNDLAFRDLTINIPVFRKRGQKKFDRVPPRQKLPEEYVAEIYLISDRRHEKPFTTDKELISYLAVMMNAINIWYEGMTEPKIRTKIVGVSRCKTSSNDVKVGKFLYGAPTLEKLTDYVNKKWPRDSDAVYVFTGQNMGDVDRTGKPKGNLLGIARKSSLCTELNVGMGEDTPGTFRGAHIAAHEIAHILGSSHDGGVGDPLIQKQGGDLCSWEDGYLMSYKDGGRKKYQLSRCSKSQIRRLISTVSDKCLEETSQLSMRTQRNILPGQIITAEDYCRGILASKGRGVPLLLPKELSKCRMQCCLQPPYGGGFCQKEFVPNGMRCAPGKTCRKGVCGHHQLES
uniref:Reprolysin n=1 Tax=Rhipicephalus appendiculatus TaxID=34631 RepID=A0A131YLK0_RHIAP